MCRRDNLHNGGLAAGQCSSDIAYLINRRGSRSQTPRVRTRSQAAISNRRLIACDRNGVTFRYKDHRADGRARYKVMTLATDEFIRRFLSHLLPKGFHLELAI
jgi:hypothetical protein